MDAVIVDTPILDSDYRQKLNHTDYIVERLDKVLKFKQYLDNSWKSIDAEKCGFNWTKHSALLKDNIEKISQRIQREG